MSGTHRVLIIGSLLAAAACAASLFRKPPATDPAAPAAPSFAHRAAGPQVAWGAPHIESAPPSAGISNTSAPRATIAADSTVAPPDLPAKSPLSFFPLRAAPPSDESHHRNPHGHHRVLDGDSLASIAERYLGDPNRAREIAEANAGLIGPSGALPIGADLVIPDGMAPAVTAEVARPITPVPLGAPLDFIRPATGR